MAGKHSVPSALIVLLLLATPLAIIGGGGEDLSADVSYKGSTDFQGYTPIKNAQDLSDIRNNLRGNYYLANDIFFEADSKFVPIGSSSSEFKGTFDGNGHIIDGLHTEVIVSSGEAYSGLFGYVGGYGEIKNLGVVNSSSLAKSSGTPWNGSAYAGGIVGHLSSSASITNCYSTSLVLAESSSGYAYSGGIVGYIYSSASITNCYNTGSISSTTNGYNSAYSGGIVGYTYSSASITNCYNTGSVTTTSKSYYVYSGGIVGYTYSSASITNCYNTGSISSTANGYNSAYSGGIVGYTSSSASITNCYNTGSVTTTSKSYYVYSGGIVGYTSSSASITNCYNTGPVKAITDSSYYSNAYAGGINGSTALRSSTTIANCYNIGQVSSSQGTYLGGITGSASSSLWITNCYYLAGMLYEKANLFDDRICPSSPIIDGDETSNRSISYPDQRSLTAKTLEEMTPSLSSAADGGSIYFNGMTELVSGWDFDTIWTIDESSNPMNGGLPIFRSFIFTVSITNDPEDIIVGEGDMALFSVSTSISPDTLMLRYQWQISIDEALTWTDIPEAHGQNYVLSSTNMSEDGNLYRLLITTPGHNDIPLKSDYAKLTVTSPFKVSGQVTFNGEGMKNVEITYMIGSNSSRTAFTDANGKYSIIGSSVETLTITDLKLVGYGVLESMPEPFVDDGTADFTLEEKYFTVSGRVTNYGLTLENVTITYAIDNGPPQTKQTDAKGKYSITAQQGKKISIYSVQLDGYSVNGWSDSIFTDDTNVANFNMIILVFTVSGKVTSGGIPTANIGVIYKINDGPPQKVFTDANGKYTITAQVGKKITISNLEITGYKVKFTPYSFTYSNSSANIVWTPDSPTNNGSILSSLFGSSSPDMVKNIMIMAVIGAIIGSLAGVALWYSNKNKKR